ITSETVTTTIDCSTTTPTLYSCPDSLQVPEECDKCEQTTTTTCTPTTTVCAPTTVPTTACAPFISEDICCGSSGPARNGSIANTGESYYSFNTTSLEICCQSCYADCNCINYFFLSTRDQTTCFFYGESGVTCGDIFYKSPNPNSQDGTVGCGFCRT
ncbi:12143_t:CDS:1, partial [Cetraspora pellucida]